MFRVAPCDVSVLHKLSQAPPPWPPRPRWRCLAALAGSATSSSTSSSTNGRTALTETQQQNDHLSPATRQRLASIDTQVNALIGKMTLAEKFGQLEMSGPERRQRHARARRCSTRSRAARSARCSTWSA